MSVHSVAWHLEESLLWEPIKATDRRVIMAPKAERMFMLGDDILMSLCSRWAMVDAMKNAHTRMAMAIKAKKA